MLLLLLHPSQQGRKCRLWRARGTLHGQMTPLHVHVIHTASEASCSDAGEAGAASATTSSWQQHAASTHAHSNTESRTTQHTVSKKFNLQEEWRGEVVQLSWKPRAFHIKGFLSEEECDHIINTVSCSCILLLHWCSRHGGSCTGMHSTQHSTAKQMSSSSVGLCCVDGPAALIPGNQEQLCCFSKRQLVSSTSAGRTCLQDGVRRSLTYQAALGTYALSPGSTICSAAQKSRSAYHIAPL